MKLNGSGLIEDADDAFADGASDEIVRGVIVGDRYRSAAQRDSDASDLHQRLRDIKRRRSAAESPLFGRMLTDSEFASMAAGVDIAGLLDETPPRGATVIHAATPGFEHVVTFMPGTQVDDVAAIAMEALGVFELARDTFRLGEAGAIAAAQAIERGEAGNTTCDWREHPNRKGRVRSVYEMSVLTMADGNQIYMWVCCPQCARRLERKYPGRLNWIGGGPMGKGAH